jgi:hypothetical protein
MARITGEKPGVKSQYLHAKFGGVIDFGFTSVPKLLIKHADKFPQLQDADFWFIVQILYAQDETKGRHNGFIKDADMPILSSRKTLQRFRKRVQTIVDDQGQQLVFIDSVYYQEPGGKVGGSGTRYNFEDFFNYLVKLENREDKMSHREEAPIRQNVPSEDKMSGVIDDQDKNGAPLDKMSHIINRLQEYKTFKEEHKIDFYNRFKKIYDFVMQENEARFDLSGGLLVIRTSFELAVKGDLNRLLLDSGIADEIGIIFESISG